MKIHHFLIAIMLVTFISVSFTQISAESGFLKDIKTNYNTDINMSPFTAYDAQSELSSETITEAINNSDLSRTGDDDTEDTLLSRSAGIFTDMGMSFTTAYTMLTSLTSIFGLPSVVFWFVSGVIAIVVLVATVAWFRN